MTPWNDDSGDWQGLAASSGQATRYRTIAQIIERSHPNGRVLDVGCGEAVLWDYLPKSIQYLGIEPSAKAAASACERYAWDRVLHITAEQFDPGERQWDCIVFNEVLYYCSHPLSLLEKYAKAASSEGIIIVSIYQKPGTPLKQRLRYLLSPNRPLSNQHCTKMVREFIVRHGWRIEEDNLVARPGSSGTWWICAAKPCVS